MRLKLAQLKGQIDNTSQSNSAQLQKLSAEYKNLDAQIQKVTKDLYDQNKATQSTTQSWTGMFNAVRLFLTAGIVRELTSITLGMASLRGNIEGVSNAFNKLPNAVLLLNQIRKATHGTIDDFKLMQLALKAENFGIPLRQLGTLLEFAAVRSQQTGISIDYLTESIITGIGRKSIKILDNLQINIADLNHRVKDLGISYGEAVGQIANEQLQKMGGYLETSKTTVDQLNKELEETKQILSKGWMGEAAGSFAKFISEGLAGINMFLKGQQELRKEAAAEGVSSFLKSKETELSDRTKVVSIINNEIQRRRDLIQSIKDEVLANERRIANGIRNFNMSLGEINAIKDLNSRMKDRKQVLLESIPLLQNALNVQLQSISQDQEERVTLEKKRELLEQLREEYVKEIEFGDTKGYIAKKRQIDQLEEEIEMTEALLASKGKQADHLENVEFKNLEISIDYLQKFAKGLVEVKKTTIDAADAAFEWEEDELEIVADVMTAWEYFFARLKIGFSETGKRARSEQEQMADVIRDIKRTFVEVTDSLLQAQINSEVGAYEQRISLAENYYDKELKLVGNNERAKSILEKRREAELKRLERQKDQAETRAAKRKVYLSAAQGIARAFVDYQYPYSLIIAALVGGTALAQLNEINKAPRGYAKGVIGLKGPGSETSDSIPAMLSKGESVMTAQETRNNLKTLKAIRAGKINDRVIERIIQGQVSVVGADDYQTAAKIDELIKVTRANRPDDLVEKHGALYRVRHKSETTKQYIRSKYGF
jgi:hypothetical protein